MGQHAVGAVSVGAGTGRDDDAARRAAALAAELWPVIGRLARRLRATSGNSDVTPSQLSALAHLEEHGALRLGRLAALEAMAAPTASRVVDGLVGAGWARRDADPDDARCQAITLTPAGLDRLHDERAARRARLGERLAGMDEADLDRLAAALPVLERLVERLGD